MTSRTIQGNSAVNSVNYGRNRAKITNSAGYRTENRQEARTSSRPPPPSTSPAPAPARPAVQPHPEAELAGREGNRTVDAVRGAARNRAGLRAGRGRGGAVPGLAAMHLVAGRPGEGAGATVSNLTDWVPARWARRLQLDKAQMVSANKLKKFSVRKCK